METTDRLWWLLGLLGLGYAAVALAIPVWLLSTGLPLDAELGQPITQDLLLGGAFAAFFLVMALAMAIVSVRARARARRRAVALRGHLDAMPLARLTADPAKAPDVSTEPLVLSWRSTKSVRFAQGPLLILYALLALVSVGAPLIIMGMGLVSNPVPDALHILVALAMLAMLVLLALLVILIVVVARYVPTLFGRPYGVTANDEGVAYRTEFGGNRFLPWSDMRLLEVSSTGHAQLAVRRFRLYGSRVRVAWSDGRSSVTHFEPDGISAEEMARRQRGLLDLIAARTGLLPRTFSRTLRAAEPGAAHTSGATSPDALATVAVFVVTIAVCLGCAAAVLLLPLTTSALFNDAIAAPLALMALLLAVSGMTLAIQRLVRPRAPTSLPLPTVAPPPLDAPSTRYILALRIPWLRRLSVALVGAILAVEIVPALLVILTLPAHHVPSTLPQVQGELSFPLAFLLALFGLFGVAFAYGAIFRTTAVIRADAAGLSARTTRRTAQVLPWDGVEDITARMRRGHVVAYTAKGDAGRITIGWWARRSLVVQRTPSDGALPITPDELAALVVKRSGLPLRLESRR